VIGLTMAPKSGKETRKDIKKKAEELYKKYIKNDVKAQSARDKDKSDEK